MSIQSYCFNDFVYIYIYFIQLLFIKDKIHIILYHMTYIYNMCMSSNMHIWTENNEYIIQTISEGIFKHILFVMSCYTYILFLNNIQSLIYLCPWTNVGILCWHILFPNSDYYHWRNTDAYSRISTSSTTISIQFYIFRVSCFQSQWYIIAIISRSVPIPSSQYVNII